MIEISINIGEEFIVLSYDDLARLKTQLNKMCWVAEMESSEYEEDYFEVVANESYPNDWDNSQEGMDYFTSKLEDAPFNAIAWKYFRHENMNRFCDLVQKTRADIIRYDGIGHSTVNKIENILASYGLHLKQDEAVS